MQTKDSRWNIMFMLMALCFISHLNRISMSVAGDARIMKQYAIEPTRMGEIYTAFLVVYTIAMIPGGVLIDRVGARRALMIVGFGSSLFVLATGLVGLWMPAAGIWGSLMLVRGIMGLLSSPLHPGCARAVGDCFPASERSLANGLITGAAVFGIACSHKVFGWMIEKVTWPSAFLVMAGVTACWAVAWSRVPMPNAVHGAAVRDSGEAPVPLRAWSLVNRSLILLTVSYAANGYFQYLFFYWMHYYFDEILKLGKSASEYYAGIPTLMMALGMAVGGWLTDRAVGRLGLDRGRRWVCFLSMALGAVFLGAGVFAKAPLAIVAWFSLALGAVGVCESSFWAAAVEAGRGLGGTAASILNTGGNAGGLLAPVLTPWIAAKFGWGAGIAVGGAICLGGAFCWLGIRPSDDALRDEREPRPALN